MAHCTTPQEQIQSFLSLLKKFAHQKNCFIPYVWGGSSFTQCINDSFIEIKAENKGEPTSFFEYPNFAMNPKPGFDCSSLVCRTAQIVGMPYFFKNTATIAKNLQEIKDDSIEEGDLILLLKGGSYIHVMVISSLEDNLFIEAGSYKCGYGKVHECSLKKAFNGINSYKDLLNAAHNNEAVLRLHKNGSIVDANHIKLYKMSSLWNNIS